MHVTRRYIYLIGWDLCSAIDKKIKVIGTLWSWEINCCFISAPPLLTSRNAWSRCVLNRFEWQLHPRDCIMARHHGSPHVQHYHNHGWWSITFHMIRFTAHWSSRHRQKLLRYPVDDPLIFCICLTSGLTAQHTTTQGISSSPPPVDTV